MAYLQINPFAHVAYVHYANGFIRIYTIIFNFYPTARGGGAHVAYVRYANGFVRIYAIIIFCVCYFISNINPQWSVGFVCRRGSISISQFLTIFAAVRLHRK